ncbi:hypothetical protein MAPG_07162 [Magnaporthiopsis poae ATCC 64411]|uniref:Uncharacterized protein n=1 Tax=Magnaporthiopsis poae (strain ATCC 64411 / 73-15) TaxID=644358 RepID=A0A0C4E3Y4_MAGP6|nr:hypothetical protein MAPG_07162 [Magnaporthiopsis poae ATCC 64411]
MMSSGRDPTSRLRAGLNPLLTSSLGGYPNPSGTPLSAMSLTSHNGFGTSPTPVSAIQPYNPQEWIASPLPGSDRSSQRYSSGESQASPLPPPPYSPPRSQQRPPSQVYETPPANISTVRAPPPPPIAHRGSPDQHHAPSNQHQSFPPPPPGSGRGPSRDRRFGIPSLRRRDRDSSVDAITPPDNHPPPPMPLGIFSRPHQQQMGASPDAILPRPPIPGALSLQIPLRHEPAEPGQVQQMAPAARRTQSTGSIVGTPTSARSRSASQMRWDPSMPVPPPPPGPPPGSRPQSTSRPNSGSDPIMSPPTRRPPPSGVAALGPVPPTPANWNENEMTMEHQQTHRIQQQRQEQREIEQQIEQEQQQQQFQRRDRSNSPPDPTNRSSLGDGSSGNSTNALPSESIESAPASAGLGRAGAIRGDMTLRERRNESRTRSVHNSIDASLDGNHQRHLSDIVIPGPGQLSRRPTITRGTPRSAGRPGQSSQEPPRSSSDSRNATPRALASAPPAAGGSSASHLETPPFSPRPQKPYQLSDGQQGPGLGPGPMAPKALPTPPPQVRSASSSRTRMRMDPGANGTPAAAVPPSPRLISKETAVKQTADQFCRGTVERFQAFAQREAAATDDAERVRLFADFIVSESRVRRERYAASIGAMGYEVLDLTRDLFRPMSTRRESSQGSSAAPEFTPRSSEPNRSHRGSMSSVHRAEGSTSHANENGQASSSSAPPSPSPMPPGTSPDRGQNWQQSNYRPSLSPILSMSVSDRLDEEDSRGRPASRWWETDSNGTPSQRLERSKRESKYMGVPKEGREALQWSDEPHDTHHSRHRSAQSQYQSQSRDSGSEYPPEKVGWHEDSTENVRTPQQAHHPHQPAQYYHDSLTPAPATAASSVTAPSTPDPSHLDVSRLVTLPPPYPRHHPAVNNNHPELAATRAEVRLLTDLSGAEATKARFATDSRKMREEAAAAAKKRVSSLRTNLQQEIAAGNMTYAEAASIEEDSAQAERSAVRDLEKADFERFQQVVVAPVNELLTARIEKATGMFDGLRSRLFDESREPSPNVPQEEGDERPELLEKLTLLKWIFEARETLHRAVYDLLSDRNDRYRDVVLTPYRLSGNAEKLANARAFFAEDAAKRAHAFAEESLQRAREFRDVVEENVSRGVEVQLSAFWDIAPPLKSLLDEVPQDHGALADFHIQVPAKEVLENPSYGQHPLQHLFSVLLHAEKSTYQFIESQTNLLCLLHEVKESLATARAKAAQAERNVTTAAERVLSASAGSEAAAAVVNDDDEDPEVTEMREDESRRLTEDLKEKVRVVQDQWNSALGDCIGGVKERLGGWLLETGGWDESLEDGGVGGV